MTADVITTDPIALFGQWLTDATASEPNDPNAMALATADEQGHPSLRMVLLKGFDDNGFVFYTNRQSRKGAQLAVNPNAALCFHWKTLRRQVRIEGPVKPVSAEAADEYYHSRPRGSQIGAWASEQSRPLKSRLQLERRIAEYTVKFGLSEIPRPDHWTGFCVIPLRIEFWIDRPFRLHDRMLYCRDANGGWVVERLYP